MAPQSPTFVHYSRSKAFSLKWLLLLLLLPHPTKLFGPFATLHTAQWCIFNDFRKLTTVMKSDISMLKVQKTNLPRSLPQFPQTCKFVQKFDEFHLFFKIFSLALFQFKSFHSGNFLFFSWITIEKNVLCKIKIKRVISVISWDKFYHLNDLI